MKHFKLILSVILLTCAFSTQAQKNNKPWSLGFAVEGGAPTGEASQVYNFTFGITGRFSYHVGPGWATFTTGAVGFGPKSVYNEDLKVAEQIPFKLGYKYVVAGPFFVMGEAGYSVYGYYRNAGYNETSTSFRTGGFTCAPSIGVTKGVFEAGLKYESIFLSGGNISYFNLRLAFNF